SHDSTRRVPMGVRLTVVGAADVVDPLLLQPVGVVLPASTNTLGLSFTTDELWIVTALSVTYDADTGVKTLALTLDHETHGQTGKSRPNPNASDNGIGPINTPNDDWPILPYTPPGGL